MTVASRIRNPPQKFRLSVRVDPRGGSVAKDVGGGEALKRSGARHLLILVHGFNNTEAEASKSYGIFTDAILGDLKRSSLAPDAIAEFHWPGDLMVTPWRFSAADAVAYPQDINQARASAARLADYLRTFPPPGADPKSLKISLVGHSLGCRLILEALALPPRIAAEIVFVGLMAAAVGVGMVEPGDPAAAFDSRTKVVKYCSTSDYVLFLAFPSGQEAAFAAGIEPERYVEAVGRNGNPGTFGLRVQTNNGHGNYWPDAALAAGVVPAIDPSIARPRPAIAAVASNTIEPRELPPPRELNTRSLPS